MCFVLNLRHIHAGGRVHGGVCFKLSAIVRRRYLKSLFEKVVKMRKRGKTDRKSVV